VTSETRCGNEDIHPKSLVRFAVYHVISATVGCETDLLYLGKGRGGQRWQFAILSGPFRDFPSDRYTIHHGGRREVLMGAIHRAPRRRAHGPSSS